MKLGLTPGYDVYLSGTGFVALQRNADGTINWQREDGAVFNGISADVARAYGMDEATVLRYYVVYYTIDGAPVPLGTRVFMGVIYDTAGRAIGDAYSSPEAAAAARAAAAAYVANPGTSVVGGQTVTQQVQNVQASLEAPDLSPVGAMPVGGDNSGIYQAILDAQNKPKSFPFVGVSLFLTALSLLS